LRRIKVLHLEPTDVCQLACPLCARETDTNFNKRNQNHLSFAQIQRHLSNKQISKLEKMYMCGVYGDPAAGKNTLDIYQQFRNINPKITLGMNTNGALQSTFYWHELGRLFNQPQDYVVFSIDGLEDTNSVYRVNSNWSKLMSNVEAFISAGGLAHWDMLVYKHNQHQVDACENLARSMGFTWFRAKVSKRLLTSKLEFPIGWQVPNVVQGNIECIAEQEKSVYIDAQGQLYPCCWMPGKESQFKEIKLTWKSNEPNSTCWNTCASNKTGSSFTNQWQKTVEL
jgi:hypothetical protein